MILRQTTELSRQSLSATFKILPATIAGLGFILASCHQDSPGPQRHTNARASNEKVHRGIVSKNGKRVVFEKEPDALERIRLEDGSAYVQVLPKDAQQIQAETRSGTWLVYIGASWNSYEAAELFVAAEAAEVLQETARVGARTYSNYSDIPVFQLTPHTSPRWVVVSDGKVLGEQSGYLTRDQAVHFVLDTISNQPDK